MQSLYRDERIKWDVFDEKSTYFSDYKWPSPFRRESGKWPQDRDEPPEKCYPAHITLDNETYVPLRDGAYIPFDLLHTPSPIIRTDPRTPIKHMEKMVDEGKEDAIKTRPRLFQSPAVSIDDVPDPSMRELLIKYMYTTEWRKASEEAASPCSKVPRPTKVGECGADPIHIEISPIVIVEEPYRKLGKTWDYVQKRAMVDPTYEYWSDFKPEGRCLHCEDPHKNTVKQCVKDEIRKLISEEELRMPHDYLKPGYTGRRPNMTTGVPLRKSKWPVEHPRLSLAEAFDVRKHGESRTIRIHVAHEQ